MNMNRVFYVVTMCSLVAIAILTGIDVGKNYVRENESNKVWILPDFNSVGQVAQVEVTAYDAWSSQSINVKKWQDGKTALNRPAIPGRTIAVDPRIIPFDSLVFIPKFGWRVAEDVGGAIKGYKIDILMDTKGAAMRFGRKKMHILWIPPEVVDVKVNKAKSKIKSKAKSRTNNKKGKK